LEANYNASSYSLSDGSTISASWSDGSGNGNDATVSGSPTLLTSEINAEPAVDISGSDFFDTGIVPNTTNPRSMYFVIEFQGYSDTGHFYSAVNTDGTVDRFYAGVSGSSDWQPGYGDSNPKGGSPPSTDTYVIVEFHYGSGNAEVVKNASSEVTFSYNGVDNMTESIYIGARNADGSVSSGMDVTVAEILDYSVKHGSATRSDVRNYLNSVYSVF
jgi:hypothetical protein